MQSQPLLPLIQATVLSFNRYVGGAYGMSNEFDMMKEIDQNGPIVVSFEPDEGFVVYKSGIYAQGKFDNWFTLGQHQPEWLKVDHSGISNFLLKIPVLCYGWGYENLVGADGNVQKMFYWKLVNSWGTDWGEQGTKL